MAEEQKVQPRSLDDLAKNLLRCDNLLECTTCATFCKVGNADKCIDCFNGSTNIDVAAKAEAAEVWTEEVDLNDLAGYQYGIAKHSFRSSRATSNTLKCVMLLPLLCLPRAAAATAISGACQGQCDVHALDERSRQKAVEAYIHRGVAPATTDSTSEVVAEVAQFAQLTAQVAAVAKCKIVRSLLPSCMTMIFRLQLTLQVQNLVMLRICKRNESRPQGRTGAVVTVRRCT
jgi:hypothetical protein